MGKSKDTTKSAKASKSDASLKSVKGGNVTKASKHAQPETVTKQVVDTAKKIGKKVKEVITATASSDEEAETSDSSASSQNSDSEEEVVSKSNRSKTNGKTNGKVNGKAKVVEQDSEVESDGSEEESGSGSGSDEESEVEAQAPKSHKANGKTVAPKKAEDSDESDESEEDESDESEAEAKPAKAAAVSKASAKDDESDSEGDDSGSDGSSEDDDEEEEEKPQPKKRKALEDAVVPAKKSKVDYSDPASSPNLFVGSLSWNVDETMLREHFEPFGVLKGVRVMVDRNNNNRSKGFGYVEYEEAADAKKAYEGMKDAEIDGRTINLDYAKPNPNRDGGGGRSNDRAQKYGDQMSEPSATLFVGNISFEANEEMLSEAFGEYGTLTGVRLPTDPDSGDLKGYGYVEFSSVGEATAAIEAMKGYNLAGRPIRLDYSTPRAGGGDRGGRGDRRGGFGDRRGGRGDRGGFGDRRGGSRGGFGDRRGGFGGRGDRGGFRGRGNFTTNRGGFGDFKGNRQKFD